MTTDDKMFAAGLGFAGLIIAFYFSAVGFVLYLAYRVVSWLVGG